MSVFPIECNPNILDAASIFDIAVGVELEVLNLRDNSVRSKLRVLGDITINDGQAVYVDVHETIKVANGTSITRIKPENLRVIGIVPYGPQRWNGQWATRLL